MPHLIDMYYSTYYVFKSAISVISNIVFNFVVISTRIIIFLENKHFPNYLKL